MKYQIKIHSILVAITESDDYRALSHELGLYRYIYLFDEIAALYETGLFLNEELPSLASREHFELRDLNRTIKKLTVTVSAVNSLATRIRH